jgi:hypothetical protein
VTFKCAYIYVEEKDFNEKIIKISTLNTVIYVFPQVFNKHCSICSNLFHKFAKCDSISFSNNKDKQPSYKKPEHNRINRDNINTIHLNSDIQKKFKHLISNDQTSRIVNLGREKYLQNHNNYQYKPEHLSSPHTHNDSSNIEHDLLLSQEIEELKKTVQLQNKQIKEIKEENVHLK